MDITYRSDHGIIVIEPTDKLTEKDFETLATEIEKAAEGERELNGILIRTKHFPGYERFSDLLAHGKFIKDHRHSVDRVALCTDSAVANLLELIGKTFTDAAVKRFGHAEQDEAEKWILS